jgi:hypothetical protein
MDKPNFTLYIGRKVIGITKGHEDWEWGIKLDGGVEFRNKDKREVFPPDDIVGSKLTAGSFSVSDTTYHFTNPIGKNVKVGLNPTKYTIFDPAYGEAYPQWPVELEQMGIPSNPDEPEIQEPNPEWEQREQQLRDEREVRRERDASEFLADTEE